MLQSVNGFLENIDSLISHIEFENDRNNFFESGLKKYDGNSDLEKDFKEFVESKIRPALINSKSFVYKNTIISLYGYLENYLEEIVKEYISEINDRCDEFMSLPISIKKYHLSASIELLNKVQRDRGSTLEHREKTVKNIVRNMYTCLHDQKKFIINVDAFALHTANFRYDSIHSLFQRIGIDGISKKCLEKSALVNELTSKNSIDSEVDKKVLTSLLISELDNLAQRRNEIAHGAVTTDIESIDLLKSRIRFFRAYGEAINEVVSDYLYQFLFVLCPKISLGKPSNLFTKINVLGFMPNNEDTEHEFTEICIGDLVYAKNINSKRQLIVGKIISIQRQKTSLEKLSFPSNDSYSISVSFDVTSHMNNREIYVSKGV